MEDSFDLNGIWAIVRRRYLYVILPAVVVFAVTVVVAYMLPRSYESKAVILIESQRIPSELASSTVTASPSERIKVIEQRLLARENLLSIADKFALYRNGEEVPSPTSIVDAMRAAITIDQIDVAASRRNTEIVGFNVSFQYPEATTVARVTNELVSSILSRNLETRLGRAAETSNFFQQQLRTLETNLLALEAKIASFKRENEAALPETLTDRRVELSEVNAQIAQIDQEIRLAEQISTGDAGSDELSTQQLDFRLQSQQLNYDAFVERRELLTPLAEKGYVSKKTMADLERQIAQAEIEITAIKAQLAQQGYTADPNTRMELLKGRRNELKTRADDLKKSISSTPVIEVELAAMNREYENLQREYSQTKAKLTDAQIGERLEQDRQAERFEVLEQATVPEKPSKPDRKLIVLAGGAGGVAIGVGLALLLEFLDKSIRTASDLERRLQLRPIAVIPYMMTEEERRARLVRRLSITVITIAGIAAVLALVHVFVLPLDLIAERVLEKIQPLLPNLSLP
ncbi:GumC family protein [Roseibium aggregatum]|uniref:Polysaccharide chain length determinant N-terminal domain-containing protein n=1 Tax=Roseibium aggregatum TaxID=187304 RepID=A0A939J119_9HYPH|nr:Wzz/FepE/Etk N-terminal domain-containing protein [Roseibium aggregatum]MBN9669883.1 hypothetical protein [Roseibium aggregatum]